MEKIINYEKKIFDYESKFNRLKKINKSELEKFQKELNYYRITTNLLLTDPNFYLELKFIQLDQSIEHKQYIYEETIWLNEHYEHIEKTRSIESDIIELLVKSNIIGFISDVQFRLAKKILKSIDNIYKSDIVLKEFYTESNNKINKKNTKQLNHSHLELFFNIIEIIILKMYNTEKMLKKSNKIDLLLENQDYLHNISKLKKILEIL